MKNNTPSLYLKGTFNGWGLDTPLSNIAPNIYQTSVAFSADKHSFKIGDIDGNAEWSLSGHHTKATELTLGEGVQLISTEGIGNDLVFEPQQGGRFTVTLDVSSDVPMFIVSQHEGSTNNEHSRPLFSGEVASVQSNTIEVPETPENTLPQDELFNALAIEEGSNFSYVFGDNVDGYFEGKTHQFIGAGRYRHHQGWYLGGFASFVDNQLLNKTEALKARLLPHAIEHQYAKASEQLSIISKHRIAAISVHADNADTLSIVPELNIAIDTSSLTLIDNTVIYELEESLCPNGCPRYVAVTANQAFKAEEVTFEAYPELNSIVNLAPNNTKLMVTSSEKTTDFTAYITFGHTQQEALNEAKWAVEQQAEQTHKHNVYCFLTQNYLWSDDVEYNKAVMWARLASRVFVSHEFGTGIWAGLPWFKDCWGRDTFIAMSGTSLVNGEFEEAKDIITNFASMQMLDEESVNYGRVPNRVTSKTNIIYNTTDGTPWLIREILEYINYSGDKAFAKEIYPMVKRFIQGVEKHYLDSDGLMSHRDPDTWMDAKIDGKVPWSPRGPKANDIQALWFESIHVAIELAEMHNDAESAESLRKLADKVKQSFNQKFWNEEQSVLADRLECGDKPDYSIRPNQLMTLTIPQNDALLSTAQGEHMVKQSVDHLLFPWGICSLDQHHIDFHPYHDGRAEYHKDAAYHNGTIWGWNAGFTVSALAKFNQQDFSYRLSKNLGKQILTQGHRGAMSENLNAFQADPEKLIETGTFTQAWSVSEYARNAQQDYLGFKPQLSKNTLSMSPKIPNTWTQCEAILPFGESERIALSVSRTAEIEHYRFFLGNPNTSLKLELTLQDEAKQVECSVTARLQSELEVVFDKSTKTWTVASGTGELQSKEMVASTVLTNLEFCQPDWSLQHKAILEPNYLLDKRSSEQLEVAQD